MKKVYRQANLLLGDITKVTPSSKVVGDLAQFMVTNKLTPEQVIDRAEELAFPASVIDYFMGGLGQPPYGFPEPLRTKVLRGKKPLEGRPGADMQPVDFDNVQKELNAKYERHVRCVCPLLFLLPHFPLSDVDVMSSLMYPKVFDEFKRRRAEHGPVDKLPTKVFIVGLDNGESCEASAC